jgi:hypothetical protein
MTTCIFCRAIEDVEPHEEDCLMSLPADEPAVADEVADTELEKEIA